ncbi:fibrinogen-like protein A [Mercenaria mercenaria]|uniref:fibrinogen-like protein A n=1 Tax=Mercenaria mercenaria TaxID=6596 RepID=UPI00234EF37D|nr:fibrinogen-like protein A [Mercenaria mercenaria]
MNQRIIAFCLIIKFIYANDGEHVGNTIINVNGCCSQHTTDGELIEQNKKLFENISTVMNDFEQRLETILGTLDGGSRIRDCQDVQRLGYDTTGIYTIYPDGTIGFPVRCDMDGGWTVIHRRVSESDFYKSWNDYQTGFGNLSNNFWLGNQQIHTITTRGWYQLRVDLETVSGIVAYAEYNVFSVGNVDSMYKLSVDGYSGNAGDSLANFHNGKKFSTKDRDNDEYSGSCANEPPGAWWFGACDQSNLNRNYDDMEWESFTAKDDPLRFTEMKIRRWQPTAEN